MFWLAGSSRPRNLADINSLLDRFLPIILVALLTVAAVEKYLVLTRTDGGGDLLYADIPKSLMLLKGENPYSVQPWASPYPPFFLVLVGGIIRLTGGQGVLTDPVSMVSSDIRLAALVADLLVGVLIFLVLRLRGFSGLGVLVPTGIYLLLPSISKSLYYYFHSDLFGYLILAASLLALTLNRLFTGSTLLALSTIFKIHPFLALVLVLVWQVRGRGIGKALPSLVSSSGVLFVGLGLPLLVPGYADAVVGFNMSTGNGTTSFSVLNLFFGVLPSAFGVSLSMHVVDEVWIAATTALFVLGLMLVWDRACSLHPVDVVLLGLLVWLLPLRQLYTHYVGWAVIPFLMRGRLVPVVVGAGLLELANTMAVWAWNVPPNPLPVMSSAYGFFLTSLVYASFSILGLGEVFRGGARAKVEGGRPVTLGPPGGLE